MEGSLLAKNQLDSFIRFDRTPTCDRQTHRRTQVHGYHRGCIALRGNNGGNPQHLYDDPTGKISRDRGNQQNYFYTVLHLKFSLSKNHLGPDVGLRASTGIIVYSKIIISFSFLKQRLQYTYKVLLLLLLHPFNGLFSSTTWISRYQKGKTSLDLNEARDDGVSECYSIL